MFSCEFTNSFFIKHLWITLIKAVYTTEQLFRRISQIDRKTPMIESFILPLQTRVLAILFKKLHQISFLVNFMKLSRKIFWRSTPPEHNLPANTGYSFERLGHIFRESFSVIWSSVLVFSSNFCNNIAVTFSVVICSYLVSLTDLFFYYWPRFCIWKRLYTAITVNLPIRIELTKW